MPVGQTIGNDESYGELSDAWSNLEAGKQSELVRLITERVTIGKSEVCIIVSKTAMNRIAEERLWESDGIIDLDEDQEPELTEIKVPVVIKKIGSEKVIVLPGSTNADERPSPHAAMITAIVKAHDWFAKLQTGKFTSVHELSKSLNMNRRYVSRLLRLVFLAPDVIEAILEGAQPKSLSLYDLIKPMPVDWIGQRQALGFAPH